MIEMAGQIRRQFLPYTGGHVAEQRLKHFLDRLMPMRKRFRSAGSGLASRPVCCARMIHYPEDNGSPGDCKVIEEPWRNLAEK